MYETEVYKQRIKERLPGEVVRKFQETRASIVERSVLHWSEHCVECAIPDCFETCDLYTPRFDGKCQRFTHGIEEVDVDAVASPGILKIRFKKWGSLGTQANHLLVDVGAARAEERRDRFVASLIHMPWPSALKKKLARKRYGSKKHRIVRRQSPSDAFPDAFVVEVYNPSQTTCYLDATIRNDDSRYRLIPFQHRITAKPGYNKEVIPFTEIAKRIRPDLPYRIHFTPEKAHEEVLLYFGLTEFVRFKAKALANGGRRPIKCVVWDLDNTVWDGTLIEDGLDKLELKANIRNVFERLEEQGILQSIASKNDYDSAMEAMEFFGIAEFFLFPKVSWSPKSTMIESVARDLNIGTNAILFVDDSEFERAEVTSVLPEVTTVEAAAYATIPDLEVIATRSTTEARGRKEMYGREIQRKRESESFDGTYIEFLRSCKIDLEILTLAPDNHERVHELAQRTNQMNFSGNRYRKHDIGALATDSNLDCFVLRCSDKFGKYGIVGFSIVNRSENRMVDLMFSCRIQSKRIEHAFITFCLKKYLGEGDFLVTYKPTEKNRFSARVFDDYGFEVVSEETSTRVLRFPRESPIPDDEIVTVR